jgi:hypothetical protein
MVFKSTASRPFTFKMVLFCLEYNLAEEFLLMAVMDLSFTHKKLQYSRVIYSGGKSMQAFFHILVIMKLVKVFLWI